MVKATEQTQYTKKTPRPQPSQRSAATKTEKQTREETRRLHHHPRGTDQENDEKNTMAPQGVKTI